MKKHFIKSKLETDKTNNLHDSSERSRVRKRQLRDASNPLALPEDEFRGLYRVSRQTCRRIMNMVIPYLPEKTGPIPIPDQLVVLSAIYFYAQGSYQKCIGQNFEFPMCQASVSKCIDLVTNILNNNFQNLITFPTTEAEKQTEKQKFLNLALGFPGIIGALDCTHIRIHAPKTEDAHQPAILFYNRKHFYSINTQCIVGADLKVLALNARYPGSVHDSAIWSTSNIRQHLVNNYTNGDRSSWLIADAGYPLEPWVITPVAAPNNDRERRFNISQRFCRNVVERFNGVFKSKFRCMSSEHTLNYAPEKCSKLINACAIVYNICVEMQDIDDDYAYQNEENEIEYVEEDVHQNWLIRGRAVRQQIIDSYF